jgi:hypothetical protein
MDNSSVATNFVYCNNVMKGEVEEKEEDLLRLLSAATMDSAAKGPKALGGIRMVESE